MYSVCGWDAPGAKHIEAVNAAPHEMHMELEHESAALLEASAMPDGSVVNEAVSLVSCLKMYDLSKATLACRSPSMNESFHQSA